MRKQGKCSPPICRHINSHPPTPPHISTNKTTECSTVCSSRTIVSDPSGDTHDQPKKAVVIARSRPVYRGDRSTAMLPGDPQLCDRWTMRSMRNRYHRRTSRCVLVLNSTHMDFFDHVRRWQVRLRLSELLPKQQLQVIVGHDLRC